MIGPCRCWIEPARVHAGHCCMAEAGQTCHQNEGMGVSERARDYVAKYVAELAPEKRAEMERRNAELFASACCDDYPCGCDAK